MIDRRSLIALGLVAPAFGKNLRLDIPDPRIHRINTGGVRVVGISPDTSLLVGTRDNETICILDAATRETLSESETIQDLTLLDIPAITWSPDGSQLSMTTRPWDIGRHSVMYVMDVTSGHVTNLTAEENSVKNENQLDAQQVPVDSTPVWLDNDRLLFSREEFLESKDIRTTLTIRSLSEGTVEPWVDLSPRGVMFLISRIWQHADGSLVFGTEVRRNDRSSSVVMIVSPDGTIEEIDLGAFGRIQIFDINETHLIAVDVEAFTYWYIPLESPADAVEMWDYFNLPSTYRFRSDPVLGPEPNTLLMVAENEKEQTFVLQVSESKTEQIVELYRPVDTMTVDWAEDVILVTSDDPAWLIEAT